MKPKFRNGILYLSCYSKYICLFFLLFIVYVVLLPSSGYFWDFKCWSDWSLFMLKNGLSNIYKSYSDYLPLYQYVLFIFGKFQGSIDGIDKNIHYLKIITLVFDFISGFYLIKYLNANFHNIKKSVILSLLFFLNISCLYNTLFWGQVDGIVACLIFLSFFFAIKQHILTALIFILLGLNLKLQSIIFIPLIGLILLPAIITQISFKKLIYWTLIPIIMQLIIIIPFIFAGDWDKLLYVITNSDNKYSVVSFNAFNFWHWVVKGDLSIIPDNINLFGLQWLTYKTIGLCLFFISGFTALFPLLKNTFSKIYYKQEKNLSPDKILIIAILIPILFFFWNTQMHERYVHTAFIFLAAYSLSTGKYFPYILCSIAYFLNQEKVLLYFNINHNIFLFSTRLIALIYFISIVYLIFQLYNIKFLNQLFNNYIINNSLLRQITKI